MTFLQFLEQDIPREPYRLIVGYLQQKRAAVHVISERI